MPEEQVHQDSGRGVASPVETTAHDTPLATSQPPAALPGLLVSWLHQLQVRVGLGGERGDGTGAAGSHCAHPVDPLGQLPPGHASGPVALGRQAISQLPEFTLRYYFTTNRGA